MYSLLPFRFDVRDNNVVLVNFVGDYLVVPFPTFSALLSGTIDQKSATYQDLQGRHFISCGDTVADIELLATRYRSKKAYLADFTSLHMVVTTLRCNQQCKYCHAAAKEETNDARVYDMTIETAQKAANMIMCSPSPVIKVEFQGGDSTLNMPAVREIVKTVEELNSERGKDVGFVICTNLIHVTSDDFDYFRAHKFDVSVSLDGPKDLHDCNRVDCGGKGTYDRVVANIKRAREYVGDEHIGALMTATKASLGRFPEIVDEYVRLGFRTVVFRPLNPYGRGIENWADLSYPMSAYIASWQEGLKHIIDLNRKGIRVIEGYTRLLLSRMLTSYSTGYVDLQSPAGAGISGAIYDYDGKVYACDEGRMLSEMGDERLCLGTVDDNYEPVFGGKVLKEIISESIVESTPACCDCAYRIWCGADPARHYATQHDLMGHKALSDFCRKHKAMFAYLIDIMESSDEEAKDILYSWIGGERRRS